MDQYIIHLARATGRRAQVDALLAALGRDARVIAAVDGSALTEAERAAAYQSDLVRPRYPFDLRPGEIGCFLSHRAAWAQLLAGQEEAALILEDDVALDAGFEDALALAARHVGGYGYVQLQTRACGAAELDRQGAAVLRQPQVTPLRTSAQLVSRQAAARLLDLTAPFDRPIDTFLQMHWHTGLHPAVIWPAGVSDRTAETGGSTIGARKPLTERLSREWKRIRYRAQVRRLSRGAV